MRQTLTLVNIADTYLKNVVFLWDSRLNTLQYKRVRSSELTDGEKERLVCFEWTSYPSNSKPIHRLMAVVHRTPEELEKRKSELRKIYPRTRF